MGVGSGLYMYDVVVKSSRQLSHLLMSSCMTRLHGFMTGPFLLSISVFYF